MSQFQPLFVLGSRSPRRLELLRQLAPESRIEVRPPRDADEIGFEGLHDQAGIEARVLDIARGKCDDVLQSLKDEGRENSDLETVVIAADTVVVATDRTGRTIVLGQPPDDSTWRETVKSWFRECLIERPHVVVSGLCVAMPGERRVETVTSTEVTFRADAERLLNWYLSTGEPRGKAGGYAIQGAGSVLISSVSGSLSNVIGLPLESLMRILSDAGVDLTGAVERE